MVRLVRVLEETGGKIFFRTLWREERDIYFLVQVVARCTNLETLMGTV